VDQPTGRKVVIKQTKKKEKRNRFIPVFSSTFENCHLSGCHPQKTIRKIQQTSESRNRAFELQLELKLHQNNLFFRFENSLRKSDAVIFFRSVFCQVVVCWVYKCLPGSKVTGGTWNFVQKISKMRWNAIGHITRLPSTNTSARAYDICTFPTYLFILRPKIRILNEFCWNYPWTNPLSRHRSTPIFLV